MKVEASRMETYYLMLEIDKVVEEAYTQGFEVGKAEGIEEGYIKRDEESD